MGTVEALRPIYEAIGRQDWDAVFRDVLPGFALKTPERSLGARTYHGREEANRAFEDFFSPFEGVSVEPEEFFEHGEQVVVFFVQRCRPSGSSAAVEVRAAHLWTLRDGKPLRLEIFPEREKALQAAGIPA